MIDHPQAKPTPAERGTPDCCGLNQHAVPGQTPKLRLHSPTAGMQGDIQCREHTGCCALPQVQERAASRKHKRRAQEAGGGARVSICWANVLSPPRCAAARARRRSCTYARPHPMASQQGPERVSLDTKQLTIRRRTWRLGAGRRAAGCSRGPLDIGFLAPATRSWNSKGHVHVDDVSGCRDTEPRWVGGERGGMRAGERWAADQRWCLACVSKPRKEQMVSARLRH